MNEKEDILNISTAFIAAYILTLWLYIDEPLKFLIFKVHAYMKAIKMC